MMNATLRGKPDAGNPHVAPTLRYGVTGRFDEGEVASGKPRRGSLLYNTKIGIGILCVAAGSLACFAEKDPNVLVNEGEIKFDLEGLGWKFF